MASMPRRAISYAKDLMDRKWHYGQKSAFALADFISRAVIRCEPRDRDRYGRIVAVCFKGDISERLAARSWLGSRLPQVFSRLCSR